MDGQGVQKAAWKRVESQEAEARQERLKRLTQQTRSVSRMITRRLSLATQTAAPSMATSQNGRNGHLRTVNVKVSAQAPTRSPRKHAPDGAMILRTEATLVRPHNPYQKRETVPQVHPVLWTVSGSNGGNGVIVPKVAVRAAPEKEAGPKRSSMKTQQVAGLGLVMVDQSAKAHTKKALTALFSDVQIAVGVSGVSLVLVPPSAMVLNDQESENRPNQMMRIHFRA